MTVLPEFDKMIVLSN